MFQRTRVDFSESEITFSESETVLCQTSLTHVGKTFFSILINSESVFE